MADENNKKIVSAVIIVICIFIAFRMAWTIYEHITLRSPLQEVYNKNKELQGISADARFAGAMRTDTLVFNLIKIEEPDKITPFIYFIEYAAEIGDRNFDRVLLQYQGKTKYYFEGMDFKSISTNAKIRKPDEMGLIVPVLLKTPDGKQPFQEPYGDEQWVIQKKQNNFNEFLFEWYIIDWINAQKKDGKKVEKPSGADLPSDIPTIDVDEDMKIDEEPAYNPAPHETPDEIPVIEPDTL